MKLLLSFLFFFVALVAAVDSGGDASTSVIDAIHLEVRAMSEGGVVLPGTSLVTVNNVVVVSTSSIDSLSNTLLVSSTIGPASTTSDAFPPVSPGHSNVHSSAFGSTTVLFSTVTVDPTPFASDYSTSPLSAVQSSKAVLVSSVDSSEPTSHLVPTTSDLTQSAAGVQSTATQSSVVQSSEVQSTAAQSSVQSSEVQSTAAQSSMVQSSAIQSSSAAPTLPAQSLTIQPLPLESSTYQSTSESITSQVSAVPSLPTVNSSEAPFSNTTASLDQSSSSSVAIPSSIVVPLTSGSSPSSSAISAIVGTPQSYSTSLPTNAPTYNNESSSAISAIVGTPQRSSVSLPTSTPMYSNTSSSAASVIVGTPQSIVSSSSPSTPASDSMGTSEVSTTSTTTITSTTTRTGTITKTITESPDVTSQSIVGKLPVTGENDVTTETFTSGGSIWTTTETGPPRTYTASLMLNPAFSASNNGGVITSNDAAPTSGACTCPSQVTITVTATPFVVTGGTLTGAGPTGPIESSASANSPEDSTSSPSVLTTSYAAPRQESSTTHSIPGFIGVTIPSGGMSYAPKGSPIGSTSYPVPMEPSTTCTETHTSSTYSTGSLPSSSNISLMPTPNYPFNSSSSTGSLLGTSIGTTVTPSTLPSMSLPPTTPPTTPSSPMYRGSADVHVAGTESVALVVGFVALVLLI